MVWFNVSLDTL